MNENQQTQGTPQEVTPESPVTGAQPVEVGPDLTLAAEPTDVAPALPVDEHDSEDSAQPDDLEPDFDADETEEQV